jgi:hypothetical protein
VFEDPASQYYWKAAWKRINDFLISEHKISSPVPESSYWGEAVLNRLKQSPAGN